MTRHDFSTTTRAMVAKALELDLVDGLDLLEMGHEGMDDAQVRYELINIAYANRHVDKAALKALVEIFDAGAAEEARRADLKDLEGRVAKLVANGRPVNAAEAERLHALRQEVGYSFDAINGQWTRLEVAR